jgi:hypothetical protein
MPKNVAVLPRWIRFKQNKSIWAGLLDMVLVTMLRFVERTILCSIMVTAADFHAAPTKGREAAGRSEATGRKGATPDSLPLHPKFRDFYGQLYE